MNEMRATREALGLYWASSDGVPHDPFDAALAEVAVFERAAVMLRRLRKNGEADAYAVASADEALARLDEIQG